jgi:hypothetical protein
MFFWNTLTARRGGNYGYDAFLDFKQVGGVQEAPRAKGLIESIQLPSQGGCVLA